MKNLLSTLLIIVAFNTQAQNVFEYSINSKIEFKVYSETENISHKITNTKDFKQDTPRWLERVLARASRSCPQSKHNIN
ncbi:hypothetical protein [Flavobacterium frigoris]|uniref:Uncharacterized protein n=1 Tax=Flavobacterium frigoris TaxID=229204 RepID=A0A1H9JDB1_FLAFI|nr:hypothetical protein [Flavobacterium frigoris]SEQ84709.1 hypothetical protein SAMN05444355_104287 [Flavobacterium frigoris]